MNELVTRLFNEGQNDGDVVLISSDKLLIKCHSYVIYNLSTFFKCCLDFNKINEKENIITMEYSEKILKIVINIIYNDKYFTQELEIDEILLILKLIDELQLNFNINKQIIRLEENFKQKVNQSNWLELLKKVNDFYIYKGIKKILLNFYSKDILDSCEINSILDIFYDKSVNLELQKELLDNILLKLKELKVENLNLQKKIANNYFSKNLYH